MAEVNNFTATPGRQKVVRRAAELVLRREGLRNGLSIALIGEKRMRQLNKTYRGKNKSTDVLAFPAGATHQKQFYGAENIMGEVIISLPDIRKNARRYGVSFEKELLRIVVHGILHLAGYDHEKTKKEAKIMFKRQDYYLQQISKNK